MSANAGLQAIFHVNDKVRCRDHGQQWRLGKVVSIGPLKVLADGCAGPGRWDEVEKVEASPQASPQGSPHASPHASPMAQHRSMNVKRHFRMQMQPVWVLEREEWCP